MRGSLPTPPPTTPVVFVLVLLAATAAVSSAFTSYRRPSPSGPFVATTAPQLATPFVTSRGELARIYAGGFEWEDPEDPINDPGVENPFKGSEGGEPLKVDAARLLGPRLQGVNLYFVGMMGSGKSAVGDVVARRIGTYNFLDTDDIVESATNMTIPAIFEAEGEDGFRDVESQVLDAVHAYVRCVISTGGGIVCVNENWSKLRTGIVVWLDVDPETIVARLENETDKRPLLQTEDPAATLRELSEERNGKYSQADVRVEIGRDLDVDGVADEVVRSLHDFIDDNPPAWKKAKAKAQAEGLDWVQ